MRFEVLVTLLLGATLVACAGSRPEGLGPRDGSLAACPDSPNCVSSDASGDVHGIAPLAIVGDAEQAFAVAREVVGATERTVIVVDEAHYLHAESTSALMRYVDDFELQLRPEARIIAVRSASRVGYGDMGVNRARVEALRAELVARGVVAAD